MGQGENERTAICCRALRPKYCRQATNGSDSQQMGGTYKLEAASHRGLNVGAAKGGHLAKLPWDLNGVVEEKTEATLVTETGGTRNLPEQDCQKGGPIEYWCLF